MSKKDPLQRNWRSFDFMSEHRIDLAKEVVKHPALMERIYEQPSNEFEIHLCVIAAYCGVILDGEYTALEIDHLCKILKEKLVTKRVGIVFSHDITKH